MVCIEELKAELHDKGVELTDKEAEILLDYLSQIVDVAIEAYREQKTET